MGKGGEKTARPLSKLSSDEILVDNKIYSTDALAESHPGGDLFVKAFAGRDATEAFMSYHRKPFPHNKQSEFLLRETISVKLDNDIKGDKDYYELCDLIDKVLPRHQSFAPMAYWIKMVVLLTSTILLECYIHYTGFYKWYFTSIIGFLMALIGLNIQHDANHGALSKNPAVNRLLGMTQNYIGGSRIGSIIISHHEYFFE